MRFSWSATLASGLFLLQPAMGAPQRRQGECTNPTVRREWRDMPNEDRLAYIAAVKCLMATPSEAQDLYPDSKSRFDDFQAMHITKGHDVHFCGSFVAWHRWLVHLYEEELKAKCGYTGGHPYWANERDNTVEAFANSPIFDNVYGLGGNGAYIPDVSNRTEFPVQSMVTVPGRTGGGCVTTGPFANLTVSMGLGNSTASNPHCLRRDFSPTVASMALSDKVWANTLNATDFFEFSRWLQGFSLSIDDLALHGGMHVSIGGAVGDVTDFYSSPGDPIFYFVHGGVDRVWYMWQHLDWPNRKTDISGPDTMWAYPFNFFGDIPYQNITLDFPLQFPGVGSDITIRDAMDTTSGALCYTYA